MSYDAVNQLTNVLYDATNPDSTPSAPLREATYSFDSAGNRTGVVAAVTGGTTNATTYAANNLNEYTAVGGTNYTYDTKGNLTGDGVWTYSYDYENRLASATSSTGVPPVSITYMYDAFGRMIERQTSGASQSTNRFYYAGWQLIDERDGNGTLLRKYVYGPGIDEPVRMTSNSTNYYFHTDALGSVTEITDVTGAVAEQYRYDVYGTPTMYNAGGSVIPSSAIGNRLLFTGRDRDPDTGLYNYRYRYYSPTLGRFVQPDPLNIDSGDLNIYRYVSNDPLGLIDPYGLGFLDWLKTRDWKTIKKGAILIAAGYWTVKDSLLIAGIGAGGELLPGAEVPATGVIALGIVGSFAGTAMLAWGTYDLAMGFTTTVPSPSAPGTTPTPCP